MTLKDQVTSIRNIVAALFEGSNVLAGQAARIGSGIDALQAKVVELKDRLAQGNQPIDPETQAMIAEIETMAGRVRTNQQTLTTNLEAMGADAETPIPDPVPLPEGGEDEGESGGPEDEGAGGTEA